MRSDPIIEETKEPPIVLNRREHLPSSGYRIVFNNEQNRQQYHNRMNYRDTSSDPSNLHGDYRLNKADSDDEDLPPPLENVRLLSQNQRAQ